MGSEHLLLVLGSLAVGAALAHWLTRTPRAPRSKETQRFIDHRALESQKMEALGRLAGGIAHDFNNVLTAIMGYSDLVLQELPADSPAAKDVEEIKKAGKRASQLTRQLLAFSRRQVMEAKVLDLNVIVRGLSKMVRPLMGEHITLRLDLAESLGSVKADPGQVEQVILNLLVNARDAMPSGGTITLRTENLNVDETYARKALDLQAGAYVCISVQDTGCGMDTSILSHLFEPFFTTKGEGKGTGLGLSTVHGIVKQSGGAIVVDSKSGKGTTFRIFLPRCGQPAEYDRPSTNNIAPLEGTATILLVEDEEALRMLARRVLVLYGYTVLEAPNGARALDLARQHEGKIDLVVSDLVMPQMNGHELYLQIRSIHPESRFLFISGYSDRASAGLNALPNGSAFLQKPFTPKALLRKACEVLAEPGPAPRS